jgi:hypothetical protein
MNPLRRSLGHLLSCKDVSHLLSQAQERPMSGWERTRVRWHLGVCAMCRAFDRQLGFLREAMKRFTS